VSKLSFLGFVVEQVIKTSAPFFKARL